MTDQTTADHSEEGAAARILGLLDAQPAEEIPSADLPKTEEAKPAEDSEPTQTGAEEKGPEAEEGTSETKFETLEELSEATGLPLDSLLNLKARAKVDGKESQVSISEILKSYQLSDHVNQESRQLAETRKAFEAEREKTTNEIKQQLTVATALSQAAEEQLQAEHATIDWNTLRSSDPAEFAAKKQEFNDRWNRIQAHKNKALAEAYRINQETQKKYQDEHKKLVDSEKARWAETVPEWKDEKKFEAERVELVTYLRKTGFSDEEIGGLYDSRAVKIARQAMLYEKSSQKAVIAQKKVVTLPKFLKPGTQTTKAEKVSDRDKELMQRVHKSGKLDDAAALIERML